MCACFTTMLYSTLLQNDEFYPVSVVSTAMVNMSLKNLVYCLTVHQSMVKKKEQKRSIVVQW